MPSQARNTSLHHTSLRLTALFFLPYRLSLRRPTDALYVRPCNHSPEKLHRGVAENFQCVPYQVRDALHHAHSYSCSLLVDCIRARRSGQGLSQPASHSRPRRSRPPQLPPIGRRPSKTPTAIARMAIPMTRKLTRKMVMTVPPVSGTVGKHSRPVPRIVHHVR